MFFLYSRKVQTVMLMLWGIGMFVMFTGLTGGEPNFFRMGAEEIPLSNPMPRIGAVPDMTQPEPAPPPPPVLKVPPPPAQESYIIREGDTIGKIAVRRNLDPKAIIALNHMVNPDLLIPGGTLILPTGGTAPAPTRHRTPEHRQSIQPEHRQPAQPESRPPAQQPEQSRPENAATTQPAPPEPNAPPPAGYVIREGDTVGKIARRFNIDPKTIIGNNHLTDPDLLIPGGTLTLLPTGRGTASDPHARNAQDSEPPVADPQAQNAQDSGLSVADPQAQNAQDAGKPVTGGQDGR
jgi:LysM repeat protein